MHSTKVLKNVHKAVHTLYQELPQVKIVVERLAQSGGRALLVGGAVRDAIIGSPYYDIDIEVHGIPLEQLERVLSEFGHVRLVGKAFGVLRIDGLEIDWSIPRVDSAGRKPKVSFDPHMPLQEAMRRRDLTMNAMAIDLITLHLEDPFDGVKDIQDKVLRVPDPALFVQDPLRYFRVMHFMGRFCMKPDDQLYQLGTTMSLEGISHERIVDEFYKLCTKGVQPSLGIDWLRDTKRLKNFLPHIAALQNTLQDPEWHPEGDVYEHAKQTMDSAAGQEYDSLFDRYCMVLAALLHDVGKSITTKKIEGRLRAFGHDVKGVPLAKACLDVLVVNKEVVDKVLKLVRYHMMPFAFIKMQAGAAAYKRLAQKLAPQTNLKTLGMLAYCDAEGRKGPTHDAQELFTVSTQERLAFFIDKAQEYGVYTSPEDPLLQGRDIMDIVVPGPAMGDLLKKAYAIQIEKGITDKDELKAYIMRLL